MFKNSDEKDNCRIIRISGLTQRIGMSKSFVYDKLNPKSPRHDPQFPRPLSLGPCAVGWLEHEIIQWIESCAKNR